MSLKTQTDTKATVVFLIFLRQKVSLSYVSYESWPLHSIAVAAAYLVHYLPRCLGTLTATLIAHTTNAYHATSSSRLSILVATILRILTAIANAQASDKYLEKIVRLPERYSMYAPWANATSTTRRGMRMTT